MARNGRQERPSRQSIVILNWSGLLSARRKRCGKTARLHGRRGSVNQCGVCRRQTLADFCHCSQVSPAGPHCFTAGAGVIFRHFSFQPSDHDLLIVEIPYLSHLQLRSVPFSLDTHLPFYHIVGAGSLLCLTRFQWSAFIRATVLAHTEFAAI